MTGPPELHRGYLLSANAAKKNPKKAANPKMNVRALNCTAQASYYHPYPLLYFKQKVILAHRLSSLHSCKNAVLLAT